MQVEVQSNRWVKYLAWIVAGLLLSGFFIPVLGNWTGPVLAVWFILTQKPLRGSVWIFLFAFIPDLVFHLHSFFIAGPQGALRSLGLLLVASVLSVVPLTFHRLVSPRLAGWLSTLPFPCAAVAIHALVLPLVAAEPETVSLLQTFLACWLASTLVWIWNQEFRISRVSISAVLFCTFFGPQAGLEIYRSFAHVQLTPPALATQLAWASLGACALLAAIAAMRRPKMISWANKPDSLAHLQSPFSLTPLHLIREGGDEILVGATNERFVIRNGIPVFLRPEDLTGDNGKYNHLYETIGGFYDDTQRAVAAIRGLEIDSYFLNYMNLLEVKPGDAVLETSVGTGLNFKYLPPGVRLSGLDLSAEMLIRCQNNMRRWGLDADLYLGNAEHLPFADCTFDVVYTAGALNFFTDRAQAIREMIRVAKPGSLLMVEDETEEYVKSTYEKIPYTSKFYGKREHPVTVPVDLIPPEMLDVQVSMLKEGKFYAITFRKPAQPASQVPLEELKYEAALK